MLPMVDDGAENIEMTIEMLKTAYNDNIKALCFTPHHNPYRNMRADDNAFDIYKKICQTAHRLGLEMNFALGNEIAYYNDFNLDLENGKCLTLGDSAYLLLEFDFGIDFSSMYSYTRRVESLGYAPIIAHPERYSCIAKKPSNIDSFISDGVILQFNSSLFTNDSKQSMLSKISKNRLIDRLFKNNPLCIVATDAHDNNYRRPILSQAYSGFCKKLGKEYADEAFFELPSQIFSSFKNTIIWGQTK